MDSSPFDLAVPDVTDAQATAVEPHSPPAGDWRDDDGEAIDSYFEAMPLGPLVNRLVTAMGELVNAPKKGSRIIRNRLNMAGTNAVTKAVQGLPGDADRLLLAITDVSNKGFYYHSESFTVTDDATTAPAQTAAVFVPPVASGPTKVELYDYTGPIWVAGSFANGAVIEIMAVTA
jgi:hypothetical protein